MGGRSGIERCRAAPRDLALSEEQLRALHARAGVEMLKVRPSPRWNCMDSGVTWAVFERTDLLRVIVSVDRMERGKGELSAVQEVGKDYGLKVEAIVNVREIIAYLHGREVKGKVYIDDAGKAKMEAYLAEYGVAY